jgi:hypothetical protein
METKKSGEGKVVRERRIAPTVTPVYVQAEAEDGTIAPAEEGFPQTFCRCRDGSCRFFSGICCGKSVGLSSTRRRHKFGHFAPKAAFSPA